MRAFLIAVTCVVALGASPAAGHSSEPAPQLFSPQSIWNMRLSDDERLDPTSGKRTAAFKDQINREIKRGWGPWISEDSYSTPIYTVGPEQREVQVQLDTGSWGAPLQSAFDEGVPIPSKARPAEGTDGHMTIYQPSTDRLWEMWQADKRKDGWHASWGGAMTDVSQNPGYYSDESWEGLESGEGWNWGSTASSLPVVAGTITIADLRSGSIDHALALSIPAPCSKLFAWPAQRTDGTSKRSDCLPEGAHLRLDPSLDISKLGLPPITRMMAEAAQDYGMIVRDRTGHATGFYAEDPAGKGPDPYRGRNGFYDGLDPWEFLPQFPWDQVKLLDMTLCTAAPCAEPTR